MENPFVIDRIYLVLACRQSKMPSNFNSPAAQFLFLYIYKMNVLTRKKAGCIWPGIARYYSILPIKFE